MASPDFKAGSLHHPFSPSRPESRASTIETVIRLEAKNAEIGLGIIGAGTMNPRLRNVLGTLASFHKEKETTHVILQIAEGLITLGQGLLTQRLRRSNCTKVFRNNSHRSKRRRTRSGKGSADDTNACQGRYGSRRRKISRKTKDDFGVSKLDTPVFISAGKQAAIADENLEPLSPIPERFVVV
jgi:hypothetical protein